MTVEARQSLFAVFSGCFGSSTTIAGPDDGSAWVTPASAAYGSAGMWTFGLDFDATPPAPSCEASLTVLDLPISAPSAA